MLRSTYAGFAELWPPCRGGAQRCQLEPDLHTGGVRHRYCELEADTGVIYKVSAHYSHEQHRGLLWNDPASRHRVANVGRPDADVRQRLDAPSFVSPTSIFSPRTADQFPKG